jgi:hypothetical protein
MKPFLIILLGVAYKLAELEINEQMLFCVIWCDFVVPVLNTLFYKLSGLKPRSHTKRH